MAGGNHRGAIEKSCNRCWGMSKALDEEEEGEALQRHGTGDIKARKQEGFGV